MERVAAVPARDTVPTGEPFPPRAVLDTNVLFSPRLRAELQELAFQGVFVAIWSPWIIAELDRVLVWHRNNFLDMLLADTA